MIKQLFQVLSIYSTLTFLVVAYN